jgi:type I restriction-modification system DNA methylase subunit
MPNNQKEFINILKNIKPSKHTHETFNDWLIMATASLYSWKKDTIVEKEYLNVVNQYNKDEFEKHAELLSITINALEEKQEDFLGNIFTEANLTNSKTGQFFTPYHISHLIAKIIIGNNELQKDRVCKVYDPCCGAGGMLIAGAMVMKEQGFNYQQNAFFIGTDIDARCARMAFIQLSLLGAPAIIICGNTLTNETFWKRETIGYHMAGMNYKLQFSEQTEIQLNSTKKHIQGELF